MKGLLIKDLKPMTMQKRMFISVVFLGIGVGVFTDDISYILGYMAFIMPMFALGTISYDEFDNGSAFLFSLPISRRQYVHGKYVFCLLMGVMSIALGLLLSLIVGTVRRSAMIPEIIVASPVMLAVMCIIIALALPLQLKFGAEKSKFLMAGAMGAVFATGMSIANGLAALDIDVMAFLAQAMTFHTGILIVAAIVLVMAILALSMKISVGVLEKKEF